MNGTKYFLATLKDVKDVCQGVQSRGTGAMAIKNVGGSSNSAVLNVVLRAIVGRDS